MSYDVEVTDLDGRRCPGMWARLLQVFPWHFREASLWSPLINAVGFEGIEGLLEAARAWRRERGLPDTEDFVVGDEAC